MTASSPSKPSKIVLVHRYFFPDSPPYASILAGIAKQLASDGHDVTVLTCQPSYRPDVAVRAASHERVDGYDVIRLPVLNDRRSALMKAVNLAWFCLRLILGRKHFKNADVVMAATTPPVFLAAVVARLARFEGAKFVYHKQDIYPEVMTRDGDLSPVLRSLKSIDSRTESLAARVVVLSDDMAATVSRRHRRPVAIEVINNFDPWVLTAGESSGRSQGPLTVVFAGNMGNFQGLDAVHGLVTRMANDRDVEFHFFGDGARSGEFEALANSQPNVFHHGFSAPAELATFVRERADLGVVSLEPGVIASAYPSKTMTYLRNGCPLLLLVEPSELRTMVEREGIGVCGDASDLDSLASRIRGLATQRGELAEVRERAAEIYETRFAARHQLAKWSELVQELVSR